MKDSGENPVIVSPQNNTLRDEALSALVALGFSKIHVQKVLNKILSEQPGVLTIEELIKLSLKQLS